MKKRPKGWPRGAAHQVRLKPDPISRRYEYVEYDAVFMPGRLVFSRDTRNESLNRDIIELAIKYGMVVQLCTPIVVGARPAPLPRRRRRRKARR